MAWSYLPKDAAWVRLRDVQFTTPVYGGVTWADETVQNHASETFEDVVAFTTSATTWTPKPE